MDGSRLTPEAICSGLRIIQTRCEKHDEDFNIVFTEGEYGKWQHRIEVSFCRLLSEAVELLKEQPHWIPISEKKPKCNGIYIVSRWVSFRSAKKMLSDVAYFDGTDTWYDDYETVYDPDRIVAWMPLPEPYRTDT